jgi:hypothetical protein
VSLTNSRVKAPFLFVCGSDAARPLALFHWQVITAVDLCDRSISWEGHFCAVLFFRAIGADGYMRRRRKDRFGARFCARMRVTHIFA